MSPSRPPRPGAAPPDADVRVAPLAAIPALLLESGIDPGPVLARCGVAPRAFDDADARIPFERAACLVAECARLTGRSDAGLLIGARFDFAALGVIALLMRNAPSAGAALANMQRYFHLQDRGATPYVRDLGDGSVALGYALLRHDTPGAAMVIDTALAIGWRMLRALCGPAWRPTLVTLAHGRPDRGAAYRPFFEAPVRFDATHSELRFDAAWLAAPVDGADAARLAALQRAAARIVRSRERPLEERARTTAQTLMLGGRVSAARVAEALGIHERSLRRRLNEDGTSLRTIVGEARFEMACQLLRDTRLPLADIASALHYADASALSRAFKAASGEAPRRWRMNQAARGAR